MLKNIIVWIVVIVFCCAAGYILSLYTYPSREFSRTWEKIVQEGGMNQWLHKRGLADETSKLIVRPNNDTLYSYAAVDVDTGPFVIEVPAMDRYWSIQFIKDNTDVFTYIGLREQGPYKPVTVILAGRDFSGDAQGLPVLKYPCKKAWLFARLLVDGKNDLPRVHRLQDQMKIIPLKDYRFTSN